MQRTLPDQLMMRLSDQLAMQTGLHFPPARWGDLEWGIAAAAPVFGMPDTESCAQRLLSAPLTRYQIEVLAGHLTVGETYFFREKASFEALEQSVFPELLHSRRPATQRLRIWSAGCCTGEEPYSIAMLLDQLLPDAEEWNITLLATDIDPAFLRKAIEGVYGEWSFRGAPAWVRKRYFRRMGSARFEIQPAIRRQVAFSCLNLAGDVYPSLTNNTNAMDVILCRNVLMYFTPAQARKVIENLRRSLADGGWLIVSPVEASNSLFSGFAAVNFPGATFYRKLADSPSPVIAPGPSPETSLPESLIADVASASATPLHADHPVAKPDAAVPFEVNSDEAPSRRARVCANQGRLTEAAAWCEQAIAADRFNPAHQYLFAIIRQELGQNDDAAQSLRRALYLDPDFVLAYFALGNLCLTQGQRREAERHFANALALLRTHPDDEPLPESDGLTAGRLMEIITAVRSSLPATGVKEKIT